MTAPTAIDKPATRAPAPTRPARRRRSDLRVALVFLLPLAVIYAVYYVYSIYFLVTTSFTTTSITFFSSIGVGWKNYLSLLSDPVFLRSIGNNLIFAAVSIVASLIFAFFIAIALSTGMRARRLYYLVFLLPALTPTSLVATMFASMLEQQYGILNVTLRAIGLGGLALPWLTSPGLAFGVVCVIFCYLIGLPIMYYTADLAALPTEAVEAALIDGAGTFRIMRSIIFPMMRSTHITVILALLLGSFRGLEVVLFSTASGPGETTSIVGTYLYGFETSSGSVIGYVSAAAVIVLMIALIIAIVQMIVTRPRKGLR